jgi:hypothetical protein
LSYIDSTKTIDCSEAQITPLSKVLLRIIEPTASSRLAVSSIITEAFPAPTPREGLPDS